MEPAKSGETNIWKNQPAKKVETFRTNQATQYQKKPQSHKTNQPNDHIPRRTQNPKQPTNQKPIERT